MPAPSRRLAHVGGPLAVVVTVAWIVACYALMTHAPDFPWNGAVIAGPMLASIGAYGWQRRWPRLARAGVGALAALVWVGVADRSLPMAWLYIAQYTVIHGMLAGLFGHSLSTGRMPLITRLAMPIHGNRFTPAMARYTRRVTAIWAGYFTLMAMLSLALFAFAPFSWWAAFANFGTPLALVLLFAGEHLLRYRIHPEFDRATLADALGAWKRRQADGVAGPAA
jgi:uncharacterized membrane protein